MAKMTTKYLFISTVFLSPRFLAR